MSQPESEPPKTVKRHHGHVKSRLPSGALQIYLVGCTYEKKHLTFRKLPQKVSQRFIVVLSVLN